MIFVGLGHQELFINIHPSIFLANVLNQIIDFWPLHWGNPLLVEMKCTQWVALFYTRPWLHTARGNLPEIISVSTDAEKKGPSGISHTCTLKNTKPERHSCSGEAVKMDDYSALQPLYLCSCFHVPIGDLADSFLFGHESRDTHTISFCCF